MTKENYELYVKLQKDLEDSAVEYLHWYNDNIETIQGLEYLEFDCVEEEEIWCDGFGDDDCYTDSFQEIFPIEKLFLDDLGRKQFADEFHQKQAEKFKRDKMNRVKEAEERKELLKKERYEKYLELQKEFGDEAKERK